MQRFVWVIVIGLMPACDVFQVQSRCGNGVREPGEQCDDGNLVETDDCLSACRLPVCGDGIVSGNEACDDGNTVNGDTCSNTCTINAPAKCGDGIVDSPEACDDGNTDDTDACRDNCVLPRCGDGVVSTGEECDNSKAGPGSGCDPDCMLETPCGNGVLDGQEECDDGNLTADDGCTGCRFDPVCGDGVVEGREQCEDGNDDHHDLCDNECMALCPATIPIFAGVAVNQHGDMSFKSPWTDGGFIGTAAGNAACKNSDADHVCSHEEVQRAQARGEFSLTGSPGDGSLLDSLLPVHLPTFWVHRLKTITVDGLTLEAGAGARCNDWTNQSGHGSNGEFGAVDSMGGITYTYDENPCYTGLVPDPEQCAKTGPSCTQYPRAILCCESTCSGAPALPRR